jgi:hypothetical protein
MEKAADAVKAAAAIAQALADGELTRSEASQLSNFVANYAKALEISDLEARLQRLEVANGDEQIMPPLGRRIEKLERASSGGGVIVVSGHSDEEHQRQIDEAVACGKAAPDSLFVCLKKVPFKDCSDLKLGRACRC